MPAINNKIKWRVNPVQNCTFLFRLRRTDALPSKNYVALKTAIMSTAKSASRLRRHAREPALNHNTFVRQQSMDISIYKWFNDAWLRRSFKTFKLTR